MGLFGKIKDILFDEEEAIEQTTEIKMAKPEVKEPVRTEYKPPIIDRSKAFEPAIKSEPVKEQPRIMEEPINNSFPFPDFDEDEFETSKPKEEPKPKVTNVLDFERKKRKEKKNEYLRLEKSETTEKKKFKPSPIISPVYGVLNEDYVADDITNRGDPLPQKNKLDVETVRNKAFGSMDKKNTKVTYKETETVKSYEPISAKREKVRTIDELLEDTADVKIPVKEDYTQELIIEKVEKKEPEIDIEPIDTAPQNDTSDNDLFDLIDSMYDRGEDE